MGNSSFRKIKLDIDTGRLNGGFDSQVLTNVWAKAYE